MPYLTVHRLAGDPKELLKRKRERFDPVIDRLAPQHGAIFSVVAEGEDEVVIVNLWESPQGPQALVTSPEAHDVQQASGMPAPSSFEQYRDVEYKPYR
jgi:hypothetical protein